MKYFSPMKSSLAVAGVFMLCPEKVVGADIDVNAWNQAVNIPSPPTNAIAASTSSGIWEKQKRAEWARLGFVPQADKWIFDFFNGTKVPTGNIKVPTAGQIAAKKNLPRPQTTNIIRRRARSVHHLQNQIQDVNLEQEYLKTVQHLQNQIRNVNLAKYNEKRPGLVDKYNKCVSLFIDSSNRGKLSRVARAKINDALQTLHLMLTLPPKQ